MFSAPLKRALKATALAGSIIGLILGGGVAANAAPSPAEALDRNLRTQLAAATAGDHRSFLIEDYILKSTAQGRSWTDVRTVLDSVAVTGLPAANPYAPTMIPTSTNGDVSIRTWSYNDGQVGQQEFISQYNWLNTNYIADRNNILAGDIGGLDGLGIAVNKSIIVLSHSARFCSGANMSGSCVSVANATAINQYGVGYRYQDATTRTPSFNMQSGRVSMRKSNATICGFQAYGKYHHTWASTGISGVSVGNGSVSFTVSSASNQWSAASQSTPLC